MADTVVIVAVALVAGVLVGGPIVVLVLLLRSGRRVPAAWMDYEANTILLEPYALGKDVEGKEEPLPLNVVWPVEDDRGRIAGELLLLVRGVSEEAGLTKAGGGWFFLERGARAAMEHLAEWPTEMSERIASGKTIYARDLVREGGEGRDEIRPPLHPNEIYNAMEGSWIDRLEDRSVQQDRLKSLASTVLWSVALMVLGIIFVTLFRSAA